MCEFCHQHGEGKKWYLQAENYAQDLLGDLNRRKYIHHFFENPGRLEKNMIHSVWTFVTPFIGGICNCDLNCMAMRATGNAYPVMFRAEFLAKVDIEACNGCQACLKACHFGAISYRLSDEKASIDPLKCYGCGICRVYCRKDALSLIERSSLAEAANLW